MIHYLNLNNSPFQAIKNGKKSVEMRLYDERRQKISIGDFLIFSNTLTSEKLVVEVTNLKRFKDFFELYKNYKKEEIGYASDEVANPDDMKMYYSKELIKKYGAFAIHIKPYTLKKVIVFDMDDTLLNNKKEVTDYTLNVLKQLQDLGYFVVINTARSKYYNQHFFDQIKPDFAILNGGALIIDKNENILYKNVLNKELLKNIISEGVSLTRNFSVQTYTDFLTNDETYKGQNAKLYDFNSNVLTDDVYKIIASFKDNNDAYLYAKKYNLSCVPYFNGEFIRLNNLDVSKNNGNLELSKILNISIEDFIVFGDDIGDIEMIINAGEGVLMSNSHLKEKYKNITTTEWSNNEDGVAKFLEKRFKISAEP